MKKSKTMMLAFLLPAIIIFLLIFIYPSVRTIHMSLYSVKSVTDASSKWTYVGINNYRTLFKSALSVQSFINIGKIWLFGGVFVMVTALAFSAILTSGMRGKSFFRAVLYLPNVVSVIAWGTVWFQAVYSPEYGFLKDIFSFLGMERLAAIQWTDKDHIFYAMLFAYCVSMVGYYVLVFVAGIDRIPTDYYEAATIAGAGKVRQFFFITLPLLRDIIRTSVVLWSISAIGFFVWTQVFSRFACTLETVTPMAFMYQVVFGREFVTSNPELINAGLGAASGVLMTLLVVVIFLVISAVFRTDKDVEF